MDFLHLHNGFLLPITKARDGRFTNPIHLLQYDDFLKIPGYDAHCTLIEKNTYLWLCCSVCQKYFPTLTFLTNHKWLMHPITRGRPKKQQAFDDFSLLPSQQTGSYGEMEFDLRACNSDGE